MKRVGQKKTVSVWIFLFLFLLPACISGCGKPMQEQTQPTITGPTASTGETVYGERDPFTLLDAAEFYVGYLELAKTDHRAAVQQYSHFEDEKRREWALADNELLYSYDILEIKQLSDVLWVIHSRVETQYVEEPYEINHFVGLIEGEPRVMSGIHSIPPEMQAGLELEQYRPKGNFVNPEDIIGPIG